MLTYPFRTWLIVAVALTLVGCQRDVAPVAPAAPPEASPTSTNPGDMSTLGMWRLAIDGQSLEAEARYLPERTASEQGDAFLLPLNRFVTASTFEVRSAGRSDGQLLVTYRVTHPFGPPSDPAGVASATNRADLGFAGVVLFLADVESAAGQTFFDGVVANTEMIANADAYWQPGGMIARSGSMTTNCFPGLNVVDESGTGNRVGISNGGNPTGNFGANGWTRSDLGEAPFTGWTGYGVLHQGQAADRTVAINLGAETSISLDVALIAKYTDPRGGDTPAEKQANRLPSKPSDFTKFAYRMPHGALDVSQCRVSPPSGSLTVEQVNEITLLCEVLDWDAGATVSTASSLVDEPDLTRVRPGTADAPTLLLTIPGVIVAPIAGVQQTTSSSEIDYRFTIGLEPEQTPVPGRYVGFIQVTDPEAALSDPAYTTLNGQLQPITAAPPKPVTYQKTQIEVAASTWAAVFAVAQNTGLPSPSCVVTHTLVDRSGNTYVLGVFRWEVDFGNGVAGATLRTELFTSNTFVLSLSPGGALQWLTRWDENEFYDSMELSPDGSTLFFSSTIDDHFDLDPGPGTDLQISDTSNNAAVVALSTVDGHYLWGHAWLHDWTPPYVSLAYGIAVNPASDELLLAMGLGIGSIDLNPGPGVVEIDSEEVRYGVLALDLQGNYHRFTHFVGDVNNATGLSTVDVDPSANIVLSGYFGGTVDFDPGIGVQERTATGDNSSPVDPFILQLSRNGTYQHLAVLQGSSDGDNINMLAVAPSGAIALHGEFSGILDVDPSPAVFELHRTLPQDAAQQPFFAMLDSTYELQWAGTIEDEAFPAELVFTSTNQLLATLTLQATGDVDPGPGELIREPIGAYDSYLLAVDPDSGALLGNRRVHGEAGALVRMISIAVDPINGSLRWSGTFRGQEVDADSGPAERFLNSPFGHQHGVVLRLNADGSW